jgi:hypothetical protein
VTGEDGEFSNSDDGERWLRTELAGRRVLIIVDDCWDSRAAAPLLAEDVGAGSRAVVTTRDEQVAADLLATRFALNALSDVEAREVLGRWSGVVRCCPLVRSGSDAATVTGGGRGGGGGAAPVSRAPPGAGHGGRSRAQQQGRRSDRVEARGQADRRGPWDGAL